MWLILLGSNDIAREDRCDDLELAGYNASGRCGGFGREEYRGWGEVSA